jgi:hypothetical protein
LRRKQSIEHAEACHDSRRLADICGALARDVEELWIVVLEVSGNFRNACRGTEIIELARDALSGVLSDTRERSHRISFGRWRCLPAA